MALFKLYFCTEKEKQIVLRLPQYRPIWSDRMVCETIKVMALGGGVPLPSDALLLSGARRVCSHHLIQSLRY